MTRASCPFHREAGNLRMIEKEGSYQVACGCGARGPATDYEHKAWVLWNQRVPELEEV